MFLNDFSTVVFLPLLLMNGPVEVDVDAFAFGFTSFVGLVATIAGLVATIAASSSSKVSSGSGLRARFPLLVLVVEVGFAVGFLDETILAPVSFPRTFAGIRVLDVAVEDLCGGVCSVSDSSSSCSLPAAVASTFLDSPRAA